MALVFLALALGAAFLLEKRLYRRRAFRNLSYRCYFSVSEAFEGDEIELVEELENRKLLPLPWLRSDFTTSRFLEFAQTRSVITGKDRYVVSFFLLKSYQKVVRRWKVRGLQRGIFTIDKVSLVATDLLGGCVLSRNVAADASVTVLPDPTLFEETEYHLRHLTGDVNVRQRLISDPFTVAGSREYTPSDPLRLMDWPATARTGQLMIRECAFTTNPSLTVLLNVQSRPYEREIAVDEDAVEDAVRVCSGLLSDTLRENLPVAFGCNAALPGGEEGAALPPDFGHAHIRRILGVLSALPLKRREDFLPWLAQALAGSDSSDIIVVTAYLPPEAAELASSRPGLRFLVTGREHPAPGPEAVWLYPFFQERREGGKTA